jgi:hypothetical protein
MKTLVAAILVFFSLVASANAFDRKPITEYGLKADRWAQTTTTAQALLKERYSGISLVYCVGVNMPGQYSSFVQGVTRWWDKLECFGYTYRGGNSIFRVIFDQKGQYSWTIYRLRNATVSGLRGY